MSSPHPHRPIVVTHDDGLRFTAAIGEHRLTIDQPERSGGEDAGPGPLEFLGTSLGACVAFYVHQFCASRGLSHDGLRVEVRPYSASAPSRIGRFEVSVTLPPEVPERFLPLIERAALSCPAHNTFAHGATVTMAIERPSPATPSVAMPPAEPGLSVPGTGSDPVGTSK